MNRPGARLCFEPSGATEAGPSPTLPAPGKTVSRMLPEEQVPRYWKWMENRKRFEQIVAEMHEVSAQATPLLLVQERRSSPTQRTTQPRAKPGKSAARR